MRRIFLWLLAASVLFAEQAGSDARFEVASVKPAAPSGQGGLRSGGGPGTSDPGRLRYGRITLKSLLGTAYGVEQDQIQGPSWMATDGFTIEATVPAGATKDQVHVMLQNLLRDRFHLALHTDSNYLPCYELTVAKGGPKMKKSAGGSTDADNAGPEIGSVVRINKDAEGFPIVPPGLHYMGAHRNGVQRSTYRDITIDEFAKTLAFDIGPTLGDPFSKTRIMDRTGLTGTFDFTLEFRDKPDALDSDSPDLFYALEKQLGLRLQKGEPVRLDVLVIDHVDRLPTEN